ncbi:ABC transporter ATP-binding protein [Millisia brevis]|uniref:ABC transporter ATP-binding protein n=1 Tax=Millisia brevis TaxID=264148 RepID=UPI00082B830F|nr:ABC transporter ATP-binding protein [Millisia brevis]
MTTLTVTGLSCTAGRRRLLDEVSFVAEPGEVLGLVGPNGVGKSTLLRTIAGLDAPAAGTVHVGDVDVHAVGARRRARLVALLAQEEVPEAELTVEQVVALGRTPFLPPWGGSADPVDRRAIAGALAMVEMQATALRSVTTLSGGERRRVLLARTLVQDTAVLLLDEPTNHLDIAHAMAVLELIRATSRTVVVSLHDLALARRFCDRIVVLAGGTSRPPAPAGEALSPPVLAEVFDVHAIELVDPATGTPHLVVITPITRKGNR